MLKQSIKRILIIMLIISLLYANANMAVLGLISYAIDETKTDVAIDQKQPNLEIQLSDICKNKMEEEETEYKENLELRINEDKPFSSIKISDTATTIKSEKSEEQEESLVKTFYKTTKINKEDLMRAIGETGSFVIKYYIEMPDETNNTKIENEVKVPDAKFPEQTTNQITIVKEDAIEEQTIENVEPAQNEENKIETKNEETEQTSEEPKGIIIAENNEITINTQTETDEEGYITIVYPEKTTKIEIEAMIEPTNILSTFVIENTKIIEKIADVDTIDLIEIEKEMTIGDERETVSTDYKASSKIQYTQTKAELGIDKTQISSSVSNRINFTITMHTNREKYDLFKNPQFIIELPREITNINIDKVTILNNEVFSIQSADKVTSSNGVPGILVKLEGEQTEHTKSVDEDIQIVIETTLTTENMIPTISSNVVLHYINENVKTYDGVSNTNNGSQVLPMDIISNKEVMVKTETMVGENKITSTKTKAGEIKIEHNTYQIASVNEKIINNTGEMIEQLFILGKATNVEQIQKIEGTSIYYSNNENATTDILDLENGWSDEYMNDAKMFLIVLNNFAQGQEINFTFNNALPLNIEEDIEHKIIIDVYNNQNKVATTNTTIKQEAEHLEVYEDENIKAQVYIENKKELEVGDYINYTVAITNKTNKDLNNISLKFNLPEGMEKTLLQTAINTEATDDFVDESDNSIIIKNINIPKEETFTATVNGQIKQFVNSSETIKADVIYENNTISISTKLKFVIPSTIKTSIATNKPGQTLEAGDEIEYLVTLVNEGKSHATVDFSLQGITGLDIQEIHAININTAKECRLTSGSLEGSLSGILIDPNETVKIHITGVAKDLKKQGTQVTYAKITGVNIYEVDTEKIINTINAKTEVVIETPATENESTVKTMNTNNMIKGVAWIDKNANGRRDNTEALLKGVQASLVNTETGERVETQITNNKGEYEFTNIPDGKYSVEFNYNTKALSVTEYKREEVENDLDSDAINTTQNNETVAKTKAITLKDGQTENANAGFVINKNFDMSVNKGITKVTVNDNVKTEKYDFNAVNTAKVEIDGKNIKGSLVLVEYEIAITNNGEVAGYAKLISDQIPDNMKFASELNKDWYEKDGLIYTEALSDKKIQPGETTTLKVILTKEMNDDKVVALTSKATLEETYNEYLIQDSNLKNNEAESTMIISLTTGARENYVWLMLLVVAIIASGTWGIRTVLNKNSFNHTIKERRK